MMKQTLLVVITNQSNLRQNLVTKKPKAIKDYKWQKSASR